MKASGLTILGAVVLFAVGCSGGADTITGSGNMVTRELTVSNFTSVQVHGAFHLEIVKGAEYHATLKADDNVIDSIDVKTDGSTLKIGPAPGKSFELRKNELKIDLTMPRLEALTLDGACTGQFKGFKSMPELTLECSGASVLTGHVDADVLKVAGEGASKVTLKGSAKELLLSASGASVVDLSAVTATKAVVTLSGASQATVDAKQALEYDLSAASKLTYRGEPQIGKHETSGASSVVHR